MIVDWQLAESVSGIARGAGKLLLSMMGTPLVRHDKPNAGFVTPADVASEELIVRQLRALPVDAGIWAEEGGKEPQSSEWMWVIDPLDGTTNFANGIAYFCVSIALAYRDETQLSVIYNPITDELFAAIKGYGVRCNGRAIAVGATPMDKSIVATCMPDSCEQEYADCARNMRAVRNEVASVRLMGAAALDLANMAAGRFDGFFAHGLAWWDVAAGILMVQEAGGTVTDFEGNPVDSTFKTFVAATPVIHESLRLLLRD